MSAQHTWSIAHAAFQDGRLDNLIYKHKQLEALFEGLTRFAEDTQHSSYMLEAVETLQVVTKLLESLPRQPPKEFESEQHLVDVTQRGFRAKARGVVLVVSTSTNPLASWAIPLAQCICDGNAVVISGAVQTPATVLMGLDSEAYPVLPAEALGELAAMDNVAVIHDDRKLTRTPCLRGSSPIIIDQSVLSKGPLLPSQESNGYTPHTAHTVASNIVAALEPSTDGLCSGGLPVYILAHENIASVIERALTPILAVKLEITPLVENRDNVERFLSSLNGRRPVGHLPMYTVRSIDSAIDFIESQRQPPSQVYVFANRKFGAYVYNSFKIPTEVHINSIPERALALGPYADPTRFQFTTKVVATVGNVSSRGRVGIKLKDVSIRKYEQDVGKRIDFFGGSFLFAGGVTASTILGVFGYGLYRAAKWSYAVYSRR